MAARPRRRIVLFLDGTWNEDDDDRAPTSIVRMRECLKFGVDRAFEEDSQLGRVERSADKKASGSIVSDKNGEPIEYVVYYDRGVGTGAWLDYLKGGVFGDGLDGNIRQAYRFLSEHYAEDDEILVFGFSRGAFTARSVVGYLFATGLLKPDCCDAENEGRAWRHYRTSPGDRYCGEWQALQKFMFDRDTLRVKCLGVFDTVGALGVPLDGFRRANAQKYAFHNTELSSIVDISLHAVAIDEHRRSFEAALWQKPKFKRFPNAHVEQIWFPGAHSDIGGGYANWSRDEPGRCGREDIAFSWMVGRLQALVPGLHLPPFEIDGPLALRLDLNAARSAMIHRPWALLDRVRKSALRSINQVAPLGGTWAKPVGTIAHAEPIDEAIHISALELLNGQGVIVEGEARATPYRPANLVAALPAIAATYRLADPTIWQMWQPFTRMTPAGEISEPELRVVDWSGSVLERSAQNGDQNGLRVLHLLPRPAGLGLKPLPRPLAAPLPTAGSSPAGNDTTDAAWTPPSV